MAARLPSFKKGTKGNINFSYRYLFEVVTILYLMAEFWVDSLNMLIMMGQVQQNQQTKHIPLVRGPEHLVIVCSFTPWNMGRL